MTLDEQQVRDDVNARNRAIGDWVDRNRVSFEAMLRAWAPDLPTSYVMTTAVLAERATRYEAVIASVEARAKATGQSIRDVARGAAVAPLPATQNTPAPAPRATSPAAAREDTVTARARELLRGAKRKT